MRYVPTIFLASLLLLSTARAGWLQAATASRVLQGDGIALRVLALSEDETQASGILVRSDGSYPFTARLISDDDAAVYEGRVRIGNQEQEFTTTMRDGDPNIVFEEQSTPPVERESVQPPPPADSAGRRFPVKTADEVRMHQDIRDVTMNAVVAYTMLVPERWQFQGHIEWSKDKTPYPQSH